MPRGDIEMNGNMIKGIELVKLALRVALRKIEDIDNFKVFEFKSSIRRYKREWIYLNLAEALNILWSKKTSVEDFKEIEAAFDYMVKECFIEFKKDDFYRLRYKEFKEHLVSYNQFYKNVELRKEQIGVRVAQLSMELADIDLYANGSKEFYFDFIIENLVANTVELEYYIQNKVYI